jgi:hypothetical protein
VIRASSRWDLSSGLYRSLTRRVGLRGRCEESLSLVVAFDICTVIRATTQRAIDALLRWESCTLVPPLRGVEAYERSDEHLTFIIIAEELD